LKPELAFGFFEFGSFGFGLGFFGFGLRVSGNLPTHSRQPVLLLDLPRWNLQPLGPLHKKKMAGCWVKKQRRVVILKKEREDF